MPMKRRQAGLTAADRRDESRLWSELISFLTLMSGLVGNAANAGLLVACIAVATGLLARVSAMRIHVWAPHPPIDKVHHHSPITYLICNQILNL